MRTLGGFKSWKPRTRLLTRIIKLLLKMIPQQRGKTLHEPSTLGQLHLNPVGLSCSKGIARSPSETLGFVFARGRDLAIPDEQQINAIALPSTPYSEDHELLNDVPEA